jgi:superfamily II DNA or RNA helicase
MLIFVANQLRVHNPTDQLWTWAQDNLELDNPEFQRKQRMGFWTGNTPRKIYLYETDGQKLILPFGVLRQLPRNIWVDATVKPCFDYHPPVSYPQNAVPLYDYQRIAVDKMKEAAYGILQSKAGSGKTQMGIALIAELGCKALWLTHTHDLLNQSKERAERYLPKELMGTITEGKVNIGEGITFATIQTMASLDLSLYRDVWDCIVVDECHKVAASARGVTMFSKVLNGLAARHKYGLSATVHRADGLIKSTFALLGETVYAVPDSAVADKTMTVGIKPIATGTPLTNRCLFPDGTLNYNGMITYLTEDEERNRIIADTITENRDHPGLILSDRLDHLAKLMAMLPSEMLSDAVMVSGKMTSKSGKAARDKAIEDMRTGEKKYLFATYALAKEGLDIPRLERLYLATPQKDFAVITQAVGRVARTHAGKADPIVYDFVDNIRYLQNSYKKRCTTYRKNGCYFMED